MTNTGRVPPEFRRPPGTVSGRGAPVSEKDVTLVSGGVSGAARWCVLWSDGVSGAAPGGVSGGASRATPGGMSDGVSGTTLRRCVRWYVSGAGHRRCVCRCIRYRSRRCVRFCTPGITSGTMVGALVLRPTGCQERRNVQRWAGETGTVTMSRPRPTGTGRQGQGCGGARPPRRAASERVGTTQGGQRTTGRRGNT